MVNISFDNLKQQKITDTEILALKKKSCFTHQKQLYRRKVNLSESRNISAFYSLGNSITIVRTKYRKGLLYYE